jgi:hypothetical protein
MTAPTTPPTSGSFSIIDSVESLTTRVLNMVAERRLAHVAARDGFDDPSLHRLWLALGELRGKSGLSLCDPPDGEGQVGEALSDLVVDGVGGGGLDLSGVDPREVGLLDRVDIGHGSSNASVAGRSEGRGSAGSPSVDPAEHPTLTSETARLIAADALLAEHLPNMRSMDRIELVIELRKILEGRS